MSEMHQALQQYFTFTRSVDIPGDYGNYILFDDVEVTVDVSRWFDGWGVDAIRLGDRELSWEIPESFETMLAAKIAHIIEADQQDIDERYGEQL